MGLCANLPSVLLGTRRVVLYGYSAHKSCGFMASALYSPSAFELLLFAVVLYFVLHLVTQILQNREDCFLIGGFAATTPTLACDHSQRVLKISNQRSSRKNFVFLLLLSENNSQYALYSSGCSTRS